MDYAATYARFPLPKLLDVLDRPGNYHPEAVVAAREELARREVSTDHIQTELDRRLAERERANAARRAKKKKHSRPFTDPALLDSKLPASAQLTKHEKWLLRGPAILVGLLVGYSVYQTVSYYFMSVDDTTWYSTTDVLAVITSPVLGLLSCILVILLTRIGWYAFVAYLTFSIVQPLLVYGMYQVNNFESNGDLSELIYENQYSWFELGLTLLVMLLFCAFLYGLYRTSIRRALRISTTGAITAPVIGGAVAIFSSLTLWYYTSVI
jgi:hypothetical protein